METEVLLTPVDELVDLVKANPNSQTNFLAKKLNLPEDLVEKWLVVLEEFKIVEITYKGFSGFVSISQSMRDHENKKEIDVNQIKNIFVEKSKERGLSIKKMQEVWPNFLKKYEGEIKQLFYKKAKRAGYEQDKVEVAWQRYRGELNNL